MWKYRDWVIKALNDDMPFDQFTIEQIAGDMLPNPTTDQLIASGFHRNTQLNQEGGIDVEEARWETLLDRVNTTGTVWLGSTIACAQCHNHKYDPFSQRDYYRLLAFFSNVEYTVHGQQGGDHWIAEPTLDLPSPEQEKRRSALADELKTLNAKLTDPSPEIDDAQPAWEQSMVALAAQWTTLTPVAAHANTATLTKKDDGSVLASGVQAGSDRYQIELSIPEGTFTGIRLEALPDPSLPKGGPGRDYYGNFVLTGFHVRSSLNGRDATAVKFGKAASDDETGDVNDLIVPPPRSVRDVAPGWSIDATRDVERLPRQAVFVLAQPIDDRGRRPGSGHAGLRGRQRGSGARAVPPVGHVDGRPGEDGQHSREDTCGAVDRRRQAIARRSADHSSGVSRADGSAGGRSGPGRGHREGTERAGHRQRAGDARVPVARSALDAVPRARCVPVTRRAGLRGNACRAAADERHRDAEPAGPGAVAGEPAPTRSPRASP